MASAMPLSEPEKISADVHIARTPVALNRGPIAIPQNSCVFMTSMPCIAPALKKAGCTGCRYNLSGSLKIFLYNVVQLAKRNIKPFVQDTYFRIVGRAAQLLSPAPPPPPIARITSETVVKPD